MSAPPLAPAPVLVVCPDTFGDLTLRQPLFRGLLDRGYATTVVVRRGYEELVPHLDRRLRWISVDLDLARLPGDAARGALAELERAITALAPGLVVTTGCPRTPVEDWVLARAGSAATVGLEPSPAVPRSVHAQRWLAALGVAEPPPPRIPVACPVDEHEARRAEALLVAITGRPADGPPALELDAAARESSARALAERSLAPQGYVVLCPGGSVNARVKRWSADAFAEAADVGTRDGRPPLLLVGSDAEAAVTEEAAAACRARGLQASSWIGGAGDLGTLLGLLAGARLYLGSDTGPMHFAAALGVPVVAVFGGGHWPRFLPVAGRSFVATQRLPCFGCGWDCWLDDAACLRAVSPATVGGAAAALLAGSEPARRVDEGAVLPAWADALIAAAAARQRATEGAAQERLAELDRHLAERLHAIERLSAVADERAEAMERLASELAARGDVIARQASAHEEAQRELAARQRVLDHPAVRRLVALVKRLGGLRDGDA
ncbi:MAG: glycosyltransferase family 9 protein [Vicinamibacteria bacterium]